MPVIHPCHPCQSSMPVINASHQFQSSIPVIHPCHPCQSWPPHTKLNQQFHTKPYYISSLYLQLSITAISIHNATLLSCHFRKIATVSHFRLVCNDMKRKSNMQIYNYSFFTLISNHLENLNDHSILNCNNYVTYFHHMLSLVYSLCKWQLLNLKQSWYCLLLLCNINMSI